MVNIKLHLYFPWWVGVGVGENEYEGVPVNSGAIKDLKMA